MAATFRAWPLAMATWTPTWTSTLPCVLPTAMASLMRSIGTVWSGNAVEDALVKLYIWHKWNSVLLCRWLRFDSTDWLLRSNGPWVKIRKILCFFQVEDIFEFLWHGGLNPYDLYRDCGWNSNAFTSFPPLKQIQTLGAIRCAWNPSSGAWFRADCCAASMPTPRAICADNWRWYWSTLIVLIQNIQEHIARHWFTLCALLEWFASCHF